jgi:hypothetical protein
MCLDRRKAKRTQQQQHGLIADLGGLRGLGFLHTLLKVRRYTCAHKG